MITLDYCKLVDPENSIGASYGSRERCEEWKARIHWTDPARFMIESVPHCGCCGSMMPQAESLTTWSNGATRCAKHHGRNPCAIEGCGRTRAAPLDGAGQPWHADDQVLCAEHWRRYVPPRGLRRRTYHRFFRQAKRHGWSWKGAGGKSARLDWRFRRYWDALVLQARRRASEGHIDQAGIDAMFGWGAAA